MSFDVTIIVPVPPAAGTFTEEGFTEIDGESASCVNVVVTAWPPLSVTCNWHPRVDAAVLAENDSVIKTVYSASAPGSPVIVELLV